MNEAGGLKGRVEGCDEEADIHSNEEEKERKDECVLPWE